MDNKPIIRQAANTDIAQILQIRSDNLSLETITHRLADQSNGFSEFLVLEIDGQLVSFVVLNWTGKATHPDYPDMVDLYTKEDERGKGYGSALIAECEKLAKNRGFKKIGLAVNPTLNQPALKLYEKLNYVHDGGRPYLDGVYDEVEDWCIDLEKTIS